MHFPQSGGAANFAAIRVPNPPPRPEVSDLDALKFRKLRLCRVHGCWRSLQISVDGEFAVDFQKAAAVCPGEKPGEMADHSTGVLEGSTLRRCSTE